ncbi:50S ribosomal protein L32e [Methanobacterium paludis]|jgi:large subunit ribosomal protein L32e|uniref:Large ribosomal subunit protein eL32 n=1 Tax=Methanobacterium paludis (strain DSM 25820 / JCM 18151 / SWAN1) TaxID=868131 RepID=F6D7K0_METPW|nr:50S ribosomal protein L32e [Methanobacterium paludis]AEG18467.1 Ribosomal protein L32e [Methanobacterium paludis]
MKKPTKPKFKRQEYFRYKKLGDKYRKPKGKTSKRRRYEARKPAMASIGYGSPKTMRGLHPSGYQDILVRNMTDLEKLEPATQAGRISSTIGKRKKELMLEKAKELGIKILNKGL